MKGMVFKNYGGIYQLRLETAEDLACIAELKTPRWAATSAPIEAFRCDPDVLKCLDHDRNGRLRTQDFVKVQAWLFRMLAGRQGVTHASDRVRLADIDTTHKEGEQLRRAAELTLKQLKSDATDEITLEQVRTFKKGYAATFPNGDGIVPLEFVEDPETRAFVQAVIQCTQGVKDAANKLGYRSEHIDQFLARAQAALNWLSKGGRTEAGQAHAELA